MGKKVYECMAYTVYMSQQKRGGAPAMSLVATTLLGFIAVMGILNFPFDTGVVADMRLSTTSKTLTVGEIFEVSVIVESKVPVNVFAGELAFDTDTLEVEAIDYNTSVADLWAEEPWYSNGEGTLRYAGGTTRRGGFIGTDNLITIRFKTLKEGAGSLRIMNAHILEHDGLGTDATLATHIDALFTIEEEKFTEANLIQQSIIPSTYAVVETPPSPDLNNDGKQSIADVSIFLLHMASGDTRFDFNLDGKVNLKDFNIVLGSS
jgi:hypothetical protein